MSDGLLDLDLADLSERIRTRQASSVEATTACLAAIDRLQPRLNAFIHVEPEQALRMAEAADAEIAAGIRRGPLHGVPLAHKDIFYRRGVRSTSGSKILEDFVAPYTGAVIEKLDAAGAVDLGGLNQAEFCVGPTGHNDHFGHCRNPWDPERAPGGSSSGSGAAVAARLVYGSIGSDTGGSIRLPAGMCGIVGVKPSYGLVSLFGATRRCWSLDVFGPLTRSVRDAALMLQAIAGYDPRDPYSRPSPNADYIGALASPPGGRRIGVPRNHLMPEASPAVQAAHQAALAVLEGLGHAIVELDIPDPDDLYRATLVINRVEASFIHQDWIRTRRGDYNLSTIARIADGFDIKALDYLAAIEGRAQARARFDAEVFAQVDVLYAPLLLDTVPTLAATDIRREAEAAAIVHGVTRATRWVSYVGLPVLVVPVGAAQDGMPIAAQLIGPMFREPSLIGIGHAFQRETDWHRRKPPHSA